MKTSPKFCRVNSGFYVALFVKVMAVMVMMLASAVAEDRTLLWPDTPPFGNGKPTDAKAWYTITRPENPSGAVVIFCSGGGYGGLVNLKDAPPVFELLKPYGVTLVTLEYRIPRGNSEIGLMDAQRMIRLIRHNAKEWNCDPKRIGVMGLSAGGHLAAMTAVFADEGNPQATDPVERMSCRPNFTILISPVITMGAQAHGGSRQNLLGKDATPEQIEKYSLEKQVTEKSSPCFIVHAQDDTVVPASNSQMFYEALVAKKVEAEYLKPQKGNHQVTLCRAPNWNEWKEPMVVWLKKLSIISEKPAP